MTSRLVGVRAVLQRGDSARPVTHGSDADRLAATLAHFWAESAQREAPLAVLAATGEITDATVTALRRDLMLLEQAAAPARTAHQPGNREWTTQTVVGCLLAYAQVRAALPVERQIVATLACWLRVAAGRALGPGRLRR